MRDVTKPNPTALSDSFANKLLSGIAESRATTVIAGGGKALLRLLKSGEWVFGQGNEDVQAGSQWVVNVMSLAHGYVCWVETDPKKPNELRGEVMVSMSEPKPQRPPPIDGTPYAEQRAFEAKCLTGADAGTEVLYKTASLGGMRAVDDLLIEIQTQLSEPHGIAHPCPVITLECDSYDHKKWGQTFVPIFEVMAWADMEGNLEDVRKAVEAPPPEPATARPAPRGRTMRAAKPPLEPAAATGKPSLHTQGLDRTLQRGAEPVQEQPTSTTQAQAHVGQRRRPGTR